MSHGYLEITARDNALREIVEVLEDFRLAHGVVFGERAQPLSFEIGDQPSLRVCCITPPAEYIREKLVLQLPHLPEAASIRIGGHHDYP